MHRFYLPPEKSRDDPIFLSGREAHHAQHVLRSRIGEQVIVLNGAGNEFLCTVTDCRRDRVQLSVVQSTFDPPPPYQVTLLQAVPKGKVFENILQKATELSVARVVPLLSQRVSIRLDSESAEQRAEKWRLVAIEAIKQSGCAWLPTVEPPITPDAFLARGETFDLALIASLHPGSLHAREYFRAFYDRQGSLPKTLCVWVGPEGDFTPAEIAAIESSGASPITLGRLVLRSETASVYCLSILNHELLSSSWRD